MPVLGTPRLCHRLLIQASLPGTYPDELVSCPLCPALVFILRAARGSLPWMRPGHLSALSSCSLAPFLPAGGRRDVNPPGNSGSSPRRLPIHAMSRQRPKLEVPELWRAWRPLVRGASCPWGVLDQRTPSRQTILVSSRLG